MTTQALLFGSIGVLAETSDIQRRAYNTALREAGVDWHWDKETYRDLLAKPGGRNRLRRLSLDRGTTLSDRDIALIHSRKTELACKEVVEQGVVLRPGVAATIAHALENGVRLALVTTTYRANIEAIAQAAGDDLRLSEFATVLTRDDCASPKPAPDIYQEALRRLKLNPEDVVAIEDGEASVSSAVSAGIYTIATPGAFTTTQDFRAADHVRESLDAYWLELSSAA